MAPFHCAAEPCCPGDSSRAAHNYLQMPSATRLAPTRGKYDSATFLVSIFDPCKINGAVTILIPLISTTKQYLKTTLSIFANMFYVLYLFYIYVYSLGKKENWAKKKTPSKLLNKVKLQ